MAKKRKKRAGFWFKDGDAVGHIWGDADMSDETKNAFMEIVKAAHADAEENKPKDEQQGDKSDE
jgi:hypothetical protein